MPNTLRPVRLENAWQLLDLELDAVIDKQNLYRLIQFSKISSSPQWGGIDWIIGNTPQQGINWIGQFPTVKSVLIKVRHGVYREDGWLNKDHGMFRYSLKAKKGEINRSEKANMVLIDQPKYQYPIQLFEDLSSNWVYRGAFSVSKVGDTSVFLSRQS